MVTLTRPGTILGTPSYMAPEQVKGSVLDRRADIWAFGCVLYEMLTGNRAFKGATTPETMAAVLGSGPDPSRVPAGVPTSVRSLLSACLARDPRQRVSHIAVARFVLDEQNAMPDAGGTSGLPRAGRTFWRVSTLWPALAAGAITAFAFPWLRPAAHPPAVVRTTIAESTFMISADRRFAITPDGTRLAYVSSDGTDIRVLAPHVRAAAKCLRTALAGVRGREPDAPRPVRGVRADVSERGGRDVAGHAERRDVSRVVTERPGSSTT